MNVKNNINEKKKWEQPANEKREREKKMIFFFYYFYLSSSRIKMFNKSLIHKRFFWINMK